MLGLIGSSLGSLAKKVLKEQAVKIGKAVYERTLKPVILKLRDKAIELTRQVMMDPLNANLGARLDEVEADIRTLERAEAKLPVESMGTRRNPGQNRASRMRSSTDVSKPNQSRATMRIKH